MGKWAIVIDEEHRNILLNGLYIACDQYAQWSADEKVNKLIRSLSQLKQYIGTIESVNDLTQNDKK